jgi:hypothetical protein
LVTDDGQDSADGGGLAFGDPDLGDESGTGRRDFRVHFVGGDLEEWLVGLNAVADVFEPTCDGAFGDGFTELRHGDVHERLLVEAG